MRNGYSALNLIEDLRLEISKSAEDLATMFPDRVKKYSDRDLSKLWRNRNYQYISRVRNKILNPNSKDYNPDFRFMDKKSSLGVLEKNLISKLGTEALGCIRIIQKYKDSSSRISTLRFIDIIKAELGRVSSDVIATNKELSLILTGSKGYIHRTLDTIKNPNSKRWYNPNYKFTLERLKQFENSLREILFYHAKKALRYISDYRIKNPSLNYWHPKDYSIDNPNFFSIINNVVKAYWYGFLCADGSLARGRNRVIFELSAKDKERVLSFMSVLGLKEERLDEYRKYYRYKGKISYSDMVRIEFSSKDVAGDLENLGFRDLKSGKKGVPGFIKSLVSKAKIKAYNSKLHWSKTQSGLITFAWLLGFYDGDGSYMGGRQAKIYSSNKKLLDEIKTIFEIDNNVNEQVLEEKDESAIRAKKPVYYLTLGPNAFEFMISSYLFSMTRKRPAKIQDNDANFLGLLS
ncbi:MAG: hypothetical protein WBH31_09960 [Promethearchaeia archaeon]